MTGAEGGESSGRPQLLSIGELAQQTGLAVTALRYYDELGLVRPATRTAGRRRYATAAVAEVDTIRLLQEVGFSLADAATFLSATEPRSRQELIERKLVDVRERQHRLDVARTMLEHGRRCPADPLTHCSHFLAVMEGLRRGLAAEESHAQVHGGPGTSPEPPRRPGPRRGRARRPAQADVVERPAGG